MFRINWIICLLVGVVVGQSAVNEDSNSENGGIYFNPKKIMNIKEGKNIKVNWYTTIPGASDVFYTTQDEVVSMITNFTSNFDTDLYENYTGYGSFIVETIFLGHNSFNLTIMDVENETLDSAKLVGTVILPYQTLNLVYTYMMLCFNFLIYINMGATLDLDVVFRTLKRPVGPIVGVISQYTVMPLASYGLANLFFRDNPLMMLGMFLMGCSPGGGLSNMFTYLFEGCLDLSITMTLTSSLIAFAAVPLWVFTLGPTIFANTDFEIPFLNIVGLVILLIIPCGLGILIQLYFPKIAFFIKEHLLKKFSLFIILFATVVGSTAYRYVFLLFSFKSMLASFLLPICGYLCGFLISTLVRRSKEEIIAISIETGVQNAQIPILILKLSLGSPTGDVAIVVPAAIVMLTPATLLVIYIIKRLINHIFGKKKAKTTTDEKEQVTDGKVNESYDAYTADTFSVPVTPNNHFSEHFIADSSTANENNYCNTENIPNSKLPNGREGVHKVNLDEKEYENRPN